MEFYKLILFLFYLLNLHSVLCYPDQGHWVYTVSNQNEYIQGIPKSLYKDTAIYVSLNCESNNQLNNNNQQQKIKLGLLLRSTACYNEYLEDELMSHLNYYYNCTKWTNGMNGELRVKYWAKETEFNCGDTIHLQYNQSDMVEPQPLDRDVAAKNCLENPEVLQEPSGSEIENGATMRKLKAMIHKTGAPLTTTTLASTKTVIHTPNAGSQVLKSDNPVTRIGEDGVYLFIVYLRSDSYFNATIDVKIQSPYGYLSAVDWPLLPFYGVMCGIYLCYALAWLIVTALQWRDLLRVQFWIGAVIFLGLIEKAVFYAVYQSINSLGEPVKGAVLFAEIISCLKRTLARMLVIIVSLGFGIVKPRLGPMLHRVLGLGFLYLVLGIVECSLRVLKPKHDPHNQVLMAGVPLAILDSIICWWIFSSLIQTTRTLRLRRNLVKLSLYQHFTNTLIFSVFASIAFMIWSIHRHKLALCLTKWKELWVDEAYWHLLFSLLLIVIMILWRPTKNNRRYAFTPLLDSMDDNSDSETETVAFEAYNMKNRASKNSSGNSSPKEKSIDEVIKWVEENIPSTLSDKALPSLLDSDEELMTAKFERNKME